MLQARQGAQVARSQTQGLLEAEGGLLQVTPSQQVLGLVQLLLQGQGGRLSWLGGRRNPRNRGRGGEPLGTQQAQFPPGALRVGAGQGQVGVQGQSLFPLLQGILGLTHVIEGAAIGQQLTGFRPFGHLLVRGRGWHGGCDSFRLL